MLTHSWPLLGFCAGRYFYINSFWLFQHAIASYIQIEKWKHRWHWLFHAFTEGRSRWAIISVRTHSYYMFYQTCLTTYQNITDIDNITETQVKVNICLLYQQKINQVCFLSPTCSALVYKIVWYLIQYLLIGWQRTW